MPHQGAVLISGGQRTKVDKSMIELTHSQSVQAYVEFLQRWGFVLFVVCVCCRASSWTRGILRQRAVRRPPSLVVSPSHLVFLVAWQTLTVHAGRDVYMCVCHGSETEKWVGVPCES